MCFMLLWTQNKLNSDWLKKDFIVYRNRISAEIVCGAPRYHFMNFHKKNPVKPCDISPYSEIIIALGSINFNLVMEEKIF